MNGMFAKPTYWPLKGYYPFYAWSKLVDCGTQVACRVSDGQGADSDAKTGFVEKKDKASRGGFRAVAAKGENGRMALLIARYSDDDNVSDIGSVTVRVPGKQVTDVRCHMTDLVRTYTEVPVGVDHAGQMSLRMMPWSFALIEFKLEE